MKLNRLIFLAVVPLVAAMGSRPEGDGHQPYVRSEVPAARSESSATDRGNPRELRILPAAEADPQDFMWQARPVVVFADSASDPAFTDQIAMLERDPTALNLRDVVVITDSDPAAASVWRRQLRPEGFSLVLMDKDGQVKQRKPAPWSVREISRAIDKFPLRLQEIGRAGLP
ncbi:DUF4174 domain-containing protein [Paracoccus shanxieyensis]|uniref:DUF4174 domain-containing protein n=1 Tax=Paracoccus shanxieyensis TaxID=2675752 RepID=A0A6L6IYI4_9RHOB|nr:DUF4174 domain-containing protein [Paracoccus shanxieyensis]MTH63417.1 DUF4174 domain-containing protein [Paracoccus shanxieyensis]MTH86338.1 DUF4174 domain-containing protein [Paracoccus shanxieyensis]